MTEDHVIPTPHMMRQHARDGKTLAMIAAKFNMYETELKAILKKHKDLQRAYDLGCIDADAFVHDQLWKSDDKGLLLLKSRMRLKMEDPVLDALAGDMLKTVLSKMDAKSQRKLSQLLKGAK